MTPAIDELGRTALLLQLEKKHEADLYQHLQKEVPLRQRKAEGLCWSPLRIAERGFGLGARPFVVVERNPGDTAAHQFQAGNPVVLISDENTHSPAIVQWVEDSRMKLSLFEDEFPDWLDDSLVAVQIAFDDRSFRVMEHTLNRLINAEKERIAELREILLGNKTPEHDRIGELAFPGLNASQSLAVNRILAARDVEAIHGPPGTGKTTTLVAAIAEVLKTEDRVLVCAPSNAACDHLVRKLHSKGVRTLRIGELSRMDAEIEAHSLEFQIQNQAEYAEIRELKRKAQEHRKKAEKFKRSFGPQEREARTQHFREARALGKEALKLEDYLSRRCIENARAVVCTLIGSTNREIQHMSFRTVFIDEASQATEPATWVPVTRAERVILAGDPLQLPPTIKSEEAARKGLSISLMEKVMNRTKAHSMLQVQYRMNEGIMAFSNQAFYGGELKADGSVANRSLASGQQAFEFIDTAGCGFDEQQPEGRYGFFNPGEANIIAAHWEELVATLGFSPECGVISPYKEQVKLLKSQFQGTEQVTVNTVDGFQGQEKEVIYVSLVRSNSSGEIGFLKDYRRLNVALTRAKSKLVVVGDSGTLGNDPFYLKFLEFVESSATYRSAWEWMNS